MLKRCAYMTVVWGVLIAGFVGAGVVRAQPSGQMPRQLDGVGVDEQLGSYIPAEAVFFDEDGEEVRLGSYLDGDRPVLLSLVYHDCPMLCSMVLDGLTATLKQMDWTPGAQFDILTVSFNKREGPELARERKRHHLDVLGKSEAGAGWHFLTGDEASIDTLTNAVGFNFRWVEEKQQFAHPATLIFLGGDGKITRYLYGLEHAPRDVRNALVEASEGTVGNVIDQAILYCFQYDPNENSYVLHAANLMRAGGVLTVVILGIVLYLFWRREARKLDNTVDIDASALHS